MTSPHTEPARYFRAADARAALSPPQLAAVRDLIERVRRRVPAQLRQASLFGSHARGEARPDSDVDVLLIFRRLPPDREPHATHAEELADGVARRSGVPVTVWSVSLPDLVAGCRTPMLVDALADSVPIWSRGPVIPPLPFTPADAHHCVRALLERVGEGSGEYLDRLGRGDGPGAARRLRDDVVRLCTALLLQRGVTRPRRALAVQEAVRLLDAESSLNTADRALLAWAARSFGPTGRDEDATISRPPLGPRASALSVDRIRAFVQRPAALRRPHRGRNPQWVGA